MKNGKIESLLIHSLNGRECVVECLDIKNIIRESDKKKIKFTKKDGIVKFRTDADTKYVLI